MSTLVDHLAQLAAELTRLDAPLTRHWRPGADPEAVSVRVRDAGADPHPDVVGWYSWHDGTDLPPSVTPPGRLIPGEGSQVFGVWHLPTLDQAAAHREAALELEEPFVAAFGAGTIRRGWFPVLVALDGWLACVDTRGEAGPPGSVFVWDSHGADDPFDLRPWFPSTSGLLAAIVAAYRHGRVTPTQVMVELEDLPDESKALFY